jgi:hypothetical protein
MLMLMVLMYCNSGFSDIGSNHLNLVVQMIRPRLGQLVTFLNYNPAKLRSVVHLLRKTTSACLRGLARHFKTEPTETVALCFGYPKTLCLRAECKLLPVILSSWSLGRLGTGHWALGHIALALGHLVPWALGP